MTHLKTFAVVSATVISLPAYAMAKNAQEADVNKDGVLSITEVQTAYPDVTEDQFLTLDLNGDGLLEDVEVKAAQEAGLMADG